MTANEIVTAAVESECRRQGLNQSQLAARLGKRPGYVSKKLKGQLRWSMDDLDAVSAALGVPVASLMLGARELVSSTQRYLARTLRRLSDTGWYHALVSHISHTSPSC